MFNFKIEITDGPLNLNRIATSGQMFRWIADGDRWRIYDGQHFHIVQQSANNLQVQSNQPEATFRSLFRLEENHDGKLEEIIQLGPELEPCLDRLQGMRMMRPSCAHETLFSFLCSANNHVSRITSMVWKLASSTPSSTSVPFKSIEEIASLTEAELRGQGFGYRAKSIPLVAQAMLAAAPDLSSLKSVPYKQVRDYLLTLPGVGPKLADCICLFAFDHQEAVPIDTHIWQQLTKIYYPEWQHTALTKAKYDCASEAFRDRFGALAGAAHQFLFVEN